MEPTMKMLRCLVLVFTLVCMFGAVSVQAKTVLKLGHIAEPVHPCGQGATKFVEFVTQKSDGEIVVEVFPSAQLGSQNDLVEGLVLGTLDMALVGSAVLGQFQPQIAIFDLPFLFANREHAYKSLDSVGMKIGKQLEPKGIKLLGYMENGIRHLTNNIRPVNTPEEMKDLKVRVMNNTFFIEMMKSLGASPTPMAFSGLYSAMQQGTVDGQENPSAHIWTKRFFEVQKYASKTAHVYSPEPVLISMDAWNRLDKDQQNIVRESAKEAIAWQRKFSAEKEQAYWNKIQASGTISVIEVDRSVFKEATRSVYAKFASLVGQDNLDAINAFQ